MTAINHALTGAFIGLAVGNPSVAIPAAFVSHFVCDAIPHYNVPGETDEDRIGSKLFLYVQIVGGGLLCISLVLMLAILHPLHWLIAAICAFVAASPDLLAIPRFASVKHQGKDIKNKWWFWRFHSFIQWFERPGGWPVEVVWFVAMVVLLRQFV